MKNYFSYTITLILQKIGYILSWILLHFFFTIKIKGKETLKKLNKPIIFACNHTSQMDLLVFPILFNFFSKHFPLYFVSNPKGKYHNVGLKSYIYGGIFFKVLGAYPVIKGEKNYKKALKTHIELLRKGENVCIFPEGKRTNDGKIQEGHGGVAYLSYVTKSKIVPISINTFFGSSIKNIFHRKKINVNIGKPLYTKDVVNTNSPSILDFKKGGRIVMKKIEDMFNKN